MRVKIFPKKIRQSGGEGVKFSRDTLKLNVSIQRGGKAIASTRTTYCTFVSSMGLDCADNTY